MKTTPLLLAALMFAAALAGCAEETPEGGSTGTDTDTATESASGTASATTTVGATGSATGTQTATGTANPSNRAPTAKLAASVVTGAPPLSVNFTITASDQDNNALTYTLAFGDGTPDSKGPVTAKGIVHNYGAAGNFTAKLVVTDGQAKAYSNLTIQVSVAAPTGVNYSCTAEPGATLGVGGSNTVTVAGCNLTTSSQEVVYMAEVLAENCSVSYDSDGDDLSDGTPAVNESYPAGTSFFVGCGPINPAGSVTITLSA